MFRHLIVVAVATVGIAALLWIAGEQHRENCIRTGKTSCSVLPWDNGQAKPKPPPLYP